jgi:hypothetical protein
MSIDHRVTFPQRNVTFNAPNLPPLLKCSLQDSDALRVVGVRKQRDFRIGSVCSAMAKAYISQHANPLQVQSAKLRNVRAEDHFKFSMQRLVAPPESAIHRKMVALSPPAVGFSTGGIGKPTIEVPAGKFGAITLRARYDVSIAPKFTSGRCVAVL